MIQFGIMCVVNVDCNAGIFTFEDARVDEQGGVVVVAVNQRGPGTSCNEIDHAHTGAYISLLFEPSGVAMIQAMSLLSGLSLNQSIHSSSSHSND